MAFDRESKWKVIEDLQAIHRNGQLLEVELRFAKKSKDAEKVWSENVRLSHEIDVLIGRAIDSWLGEAEAVIGKLAEARGGLQDAIDAIKETIKTATGVVRAIGYVDDALRIAGQLARYA